jgi:hypothetical protein
MTSLVDPAVERLVVQGQRPDPAIDAVFEFLDRQPVSVHGVPEPEKLDLRNIHLLDVSKLAPTKNAIPEEHQAIAQWTRQRVQTVMLGPLDAESPIQPKRLATQVVIGRRALNVDQSLGKHEIDENPDGERTATETEAVDLVAQLIISTKKRVQGEDVALEPPPERTAENGKRLYRRCPDSIVVKCDLARIR